MSKISPMQAAALGLIPPPTTAGTTAPKPIAAPTAAIKAKVVEANVAKPTSLKPAAAKTVATAKPAVKTVSKTAAKTATKTAPKTASKTALKPMSKTTRSANVKQDHKKNDPHKDNQKNTHKKDDKKIRPEKVKMERDSFTMPKDEYAQLTLLKARLMSMGQPAKKSELLRAGIKLLAAMSDNTLKTTLAKIPVIKTGRPNK